MAGLRIDTRLRPCYVRLNSTCSEKALFHCWSYESGAMTGMMAICELENGDVVRVLPKNIHFVPGEFNAYIWDDEEELNDQSN